MLTLGLPILLGAAASVKPLDEALAPRRSTGPAVQPAAPGPGLYAITPERRAALETIRYAEGTWTGGSSAGYRTLYGGGQVISLERHPDTVVVKRYASAAAGAYQFMPSTWQAASSRLGLKGFGPANQDQAALHLAERRGALAGIDRGELCTDTLDRLAQEWASLPTALGSSAYGQPAKTAAELRQFHQVSLRRHRLRAQAA
jgi:muramidase (phage lysozyme)